MEYLEREVGRKAALSNRPDKLINIFPVLVAVINEGGRMIRRINRNCWGARAQGSVGYLFGGAPKTGKWMGDGTGGKGSTQYYFPDRFNLAKHFCSCIKVFLALAQI